MVYLLIVLAWAAGCSADGGIAYRGPPPVKEVFHLNKDTSYYLYSERVSWNEASAICQSNKGQLAQADDSNKAAFLAQSIADAWAALETMWIGGHQVHSEWQWVGSSKKLPELPRQAPNTTFLFPPWVDGAQPNRVGRDCLAIDRNGHSDPYFIDLECKVSRPFICEVVTKGKTDEPGAQKKFRIFDYDFTLYHGRLTWEGAVAFCRSQGAVLASVFNSSYAEKLAKAMLKNRPEFEDVWIGGSYKGDKWEWVENSQEISMDGAVEGGELAFPPWARASPEPDNCILFDRHLCEAPKFIDVKCNRLRDFVCATIDKPEGEEPPPEKTTTVRNKTYILHHQMANFYEARIICENPKNPEGAGKLLYIDGGATQDPYEELSYIMQIMSDDKDELLHVWLAAQYDTDIGAFKWLYDEPNYHVGLPGLDQVLDTATNEATGYPPWCNNDEPTPEMPCLNLDRQNYNTPLFYGLECNVSQSVICVVEAKLKGAERFSVGVRSYQSSDYIQTQAVTKWTNAVKICEEETGSLLTDAEEDDLNQIAAKLADGEYYIGARYTGSKHVPKWVPSLKTVSLGSVKIDDFESGNNCLALVVQHSAVSGLKGVPCDEPRQTGYVCSDNCRTDLVDEVADKSWHCSWHEGRGVNEAVLYKTCEKKCRADEVLIGSRKLSCTANGWAGARQAKPGTCNSTQDAARSVSELITSATNNDGVLLIVDGSKDVTAEERKLIEYLMASTITSVSEPSDARGRRHAHTHRRGRKPRRHRAADHVFVSRINLDRSNQELDVLPESADPCQVVKQLAETPLHRGGGRRDYAAAFAQAKEQLDQVDTPYTVIVISAGPNQGADFQASLRALKSVAKSIATIGIGNKQSHEELSTIATANQKEDLQHVSISDYEIVKEVADQLEAVTGKCSEELSPLKLEAEEAVQIISASKTDGAVIPPPQPEETEPPPDADAEADSLNEQGSEEPKPNGDNKSSTENNTTSTTEEDPSKPKGEITTIIGGESITTVTPNNTDTTTVTPNNTDTSTVTPNNTDTTTVTPNNTDTSTKDTPTTTTTGSTTTEDVKENN